MEDRLTIKQRWALAGIIITILIGPVVMLLLACSAHGHKQEPTPAPNPVISVRPV
jgi:hypothetical protein